MPCVWETGRLLEWGPHKKLKTLWQKQPCLYNPAEKSHSPMDPFFHAPHIIFIFHPAGSSTEIIEKTQVAPSFRQPHMLMHHNSQWNQCSGQLSITCCTHNSQRNATVRGPVMHIFCSKQPKHPLVAGQTLTTGGWWSIRSSRFSCF